MKSNFESPLKIVDGAVRAKGRLNWEEGESESLVSVSISQKQNKVAGMATSAEKFEKPKRTWTLDIYPGYTGGRYDALVHQGDGATTVVAGTGSLTQLTEMAKSLEMA